MMTPLELDAFHQALCEGQTMDKPDGWTQKAINEINIVDSSLLKDVLETVQANASLASEFHSILWKAGQSLENNEWGDRDQIRVWLRVHLKAQHSIGRLTSTKDMMRSIEDCSRIAALALQSASIVDPTEAQVNAAIMIGVIDDRENCTVTAGDINYIADRLDEVEPLIKELTARRSFDRDSIEILLGSAATSLREGEL